MKKLTHKDMESRLQQTHRNSFKMLENYVDSRTKIMVSHKCGYEWRTNPRYLIEGHGCPSCSRKKRRTTKEFKEEIKSLVGNDYSVLGEYKANNQSILMRHNECGLEFYMHPKSFLSGQRCPNERYKKSSLSNRYSSNKIKEELKEVHGEEYEIVGGYKGSSRKANVKHKKCGRIFQPTPRQLIRRKTGCPYCYISRGEDVIKKFLLKENYIFKEQYRIKECKNERPLPFDFAIFDSNNELVFLIEYDGAQHFSPKFGEENFKKTQFHDEIKNEYCTKNRIPLIRIKCKRSENIKLFEEKILNDLKPKLFNMAIPSQAHQK